MLNEEVIEKVIARLTRRIEQGNEYILEKMGKSIKKIGTLEPYQAYQLGQLMKYGGDYEKIVNKIAEITRLNIKDIYKIFEEVAKNDYNFAKQFYDYRNQKFIPYEENMQLRNQVEALATITANEYRNLTRTLAFTKIVNGKVVYTPLAIAYENMLDKAVLSVTQGKTTFQEEMYHMVKELAESGIKTVNYGTNRSVRLDSAVAMQMKGALRTLHNEMQEQLGKEFGSDGVEISVHQYPAPDHAEVQGRQFSNVEFEKFQNDIDAVDYKGKSFPAEFEGHDRRSISQYNCYHYTFAIILGVNEPEYNDEELRNIINDNNKGFNFVGKHYTNYEGTQLQRQIETEVRRQKEVQIMAKASGETQLVQEAQQKIRLLSEKYKALSEISGLPTIMERMRVPNYKKVAKVK